jgi:predicted ArsR family transcriptional regulator
LPLGARVLDSRTMKTRETGATRREILERLKREGPRTAAELAKPLGVSTVAVRQHLQLLAQQELVYSEPEKQPVGRPVHRWFLSESALALFPDHHGALAADLLEAIDEKLGSEALRSVLDDQTERTLRRYRKQMPEPDAPLERRVQALTALRSEEGHMAECVKEDEDHWLLLQNHCPIHAAVTTCHTVCDYEPRLFEAALGDGVRVERTEASVRDGHRRCAYRITASQGS